MADRSIHLIQNGFLKPVIKKVSDVGINIDKLVKKSGLTQFNLDDPEVYIPVNLVYDLLTLLEKETKIDNFFCYFMPTMQAMSMTNITEIMVSTPDLLTTFKLAEEHDQVIFTHERMKLDINSTRSTFSSWFVDDPLPGRELLELLNLALMINTVRLACGHHWLPLEIHLQHDDVSCLHAILPKDGTVKVLTNQDATALIFPTNILNMPMLGRTISEASYEEIFVTPMCLSQKVGQLLESNTLGYLPNLTHISTLSGMSSRSIQRKLKEEGTSYREILDYWRFKRSVVLLKSSELHIKEISCQLGYSNASNFERAFHRWTDTTPEHFRQNFLS